MLHVWTNLIDNAVKFDPPGGLVRLEMCRDPETITVAVSDSGPGMTEEEISHIFDRFYQGDGSHRGEGSGLGLPLVQRILSAVGGSIRVQSAPGRGSRFVVTLPVK